MTSEIRANKQTNRVGLGTVEYTNTGIIVSGIVTANSFSGPFTGDLDVDGHTNLDNVSISGVTTTSRLDISSTTPIIDLLETDGNPDYRIYAEGGEFVIRQQNPSVSNRLVINSTGVSVPNDLDVDGHTNLDNVSIAGVTTFASNVFLGDDDNLYLGASNDLRIYHDAGAASHINAVGLVNIDGTTGVRLEYNNANRVYCTSSGVTLGGDIEIADKIVHEGDTNTAIRFPAADNISFETAGDERLRISSTGLLTVKPADTSSNYATNDGGLDIGLSINSTGTSSSQSIGITFNLTKSGETGAISEIGAIREGNGLSGLVFRTRDNTTGRNERLRITSGGKIGINQDTPTAELEVAPAGSGTSSTIFIHAPTHNTNAQSEAILKFGYGHSGNPDGVGHIKMVEDANNSFDADFIFGLPINNNSGGSITNERVRITSEGQLRVQGISNTSTSTSNVFPVLNINNLKGSYSAGNIIGGVTFGKSPGHTGGIRAGMLALYSNTGSDSSNVGTDLVFRTASESAGDSNEKLRIKSDGKVGIGEDDPVNRLVVQEANASGDVGIRVKNDTTTDGDSTNPTTASLFLNTSTGTFNTFYIQARRNDNNTHFGYADPRTVGHIPTMCITGNSKRVGINESNPDTKLHVKSTGNESTVLKLEPGTTAGNYGGIELGRTDGGGTVRMTTVVKGGVPISGISGIEFGSSDTNLPAVSLASANSSNGHIAFKPKGTEKVRITSDGDLKTTDPSNVSYTTASDGSSNHNLVYKQDNIIQGNGGSGYYNMRAWRAHKTGTVRMQAYLYIVSGAYYFNIRVYDATAGSVVFNMADGGGYGNYEYPSGQSGNVHNSKQYSWAVDVIAGHNYQVQMIPSSGNGQTTYNSATQGLFIDSFRVYSDSPGLSYPFSQIQIAQDWGHSGVDTTYETVQQGYNTGTLNQFEEFRGVGDTLIGHFNHRAYGQYAFYEFDTTSNSYMFYVRAVGYLYGLGFINAMKGGYMYNNGVINIFGGGMSGSRAIYNLTRSSSGRLVVVIDSGGTGYTEGNYALFFGNFGPSNPPKLTRYRRQNSSSNPF